MTLRRRPVLGIVRWGLDLVPGYKMYATLVIEAALCESEYVTTCQRREPMGECPLLHALDPPLENSR